MPRPASAADDQRRGGVRRLCRLRLSPRRCCPQRPAPSSSSRQCHGHWNLRAERRCLRDTTGTGSAYHAGGLNPVSTRLAGYDSSAATCLGPCRGGASPGRNAGKRSMTPRHPADLAVATGGGFVSVMLLPPSSPVGRPRSAGRPGSRSSSCSRLSSAASRWPQWSWLFTSAVAGESQSASSETSLAFVEHWRRAGKARVLACLRPAADRRAFVVAPRRGRPNDHYVEPLARALAQGVRAIS
jgi:hypothetical protein